MPKKSCAALSRSAHKEKPTPLFSNDPVEILDKIDETLLNYENEPADTFEPTEDEKTVLFRTCLLTESTGDAIIEPIAEAAAEMIVESAAEPIQSPPIEAAVVESVESPVATREPLLVSAASGKKPEVEGKKKNRRRRQIDPTTCERDYTNDEIEFMNALNEYKRNSNRMFPTCSEILEVIRSLGYVKLPEQDEEDESSSRARMEPTPLQSGTPALAGEENGENEEIVTIFWNSESAKPDQSTEEYAAEMNGPDDDFEYREPLLIF